MDPDSPVLRSTNMRSMYTCVYIYIYIYIYIVYYIYIYIHTLRCVLASCVCHAHPPARLLVQCLLQLLRHACWCRGSNIIAAPCIPCYKVLCRAMEYHATVRCAASRQTILLCCNIGQSNDMSRGVLGQRTEGHERKKRQKDQRPEGARPAFESRSGKMDLEPGRL